MTTLNRAKVEQITSAPIHWRHWAVAETVAPVVLRHRNVPDLAHPAEVVVFERTDGTDEHSYGLVIDGERLRIAYANPRTHALRLARHVAEYGWEQSSPGAIEHGYYVTPVAQ